MATVLEAVRNMSNFHLYMTLGTHLAAPISFHMTVPKIYGVTSANNEGWASLLETHDYSWRIASATFGEMTTRRGLAATSDPGSLQKRYKRLSAPLCGPMG